MQALHRPSSIVSVLGSTRCSTCYSTSPPSFGSAPSTACGDATASKVLEGAYVNGRCGVVTHPSSTKTSIAALYLAVCKTVIDGRALECHCAQSCCRDGCCGSGWSRMCLMTTVSLQATIVGRSRRRPTCARAAVASLTLRAKGVGGFPSLGVVGEGKRSLDAQGLISSLVVHGRARSASRGSHCAPVERELEPDIFERRQRHRHGLACHRPPASARGRATRCESVA
jgi:hypothetical protein